MISEADAKAGGPNVQAWLPAGEVYLVPEIAGAVAEIKAGKITSLSAKSGWDANVDGKAIIENGALK